MAERRNLMKPRKESLTREPNDPTPAEIKEICEALQLNWSEQEKWKRQHFIIGDGIQGRRVIPNNGYQIPVISNTEFENNIGEEAKRSTRTVMKECF